MTKKIWAIISILLFLVYVSYFCFSLADKSSEIAVVDGQAFVTDENFGSGEKIFLVGDWEFYFNEFLSPMEVEEKTDKKYRYIPDYWQRDWSDDSVEINGFATYRVVVNFESVKEIVSLDMPWVFGAYELFVNDKKIADVGKISKTPEGEVAEIITKTFAIPINSDKMEIVIKYSGHVSGISGLYKRIAVGDDMAVQGYVNKEIFKEALFIGFFFVMAFYHLALFVLRRNFKANLAFALWCFVAIIRQGTIGRGLIYYLLPAGSGNLGYDIYSLSIFWLVFLVAVFTYYLFGKQYKLSRKPIIVMLALCVFTTIFCFFWQYNFSWTKFILAYINNLFVTIYLIRIVYVIFKNKDKFRWNITYAFVFLAFANYADALRDFGFLNTDLFGNTAFAICIFIEAIILARIYTGYFREKEKIMQNLELEVRKRTKELENANARLILMEENRNELMSNISHDLRTPITAVKGYMELLLLEPEVGENSKKYIACTSSRINQLEKLISDLFLLTRLTEKRLPMNLEVIDVADLMKEIENNYLNTAKSKGILFAIVSDCEAEKLTVERVRFMQIIDNIVQNAFVYAKTKIIIKVEQESENCVFTIENDGKKIPEEDVGRLFERFFKIRNDGTGLGLSIVKGLVEQMNGGTFARNIEDGVQIGFYLPILQEK